MSTVAQAKFRQFIYRLFAIAVGVAVIVLVSFLTSDKFKSIVDTLTPPELPLLQVRNPDGSWVKQYWPDQNWGSHGDYVSDDARKYHHISQGTRTIPIPYEWFINLEQPSQSVSSFLLLNWFSDNGLLTDDEFILRFGFIRSEAHPEYNPDGLPIGLARSPSITLPGYSTQTNGIGFTCAACHTGHFIHDNKGEKVEYVVDGAPATTDLTQLTRTLSASLGQTALSSKLSLFDGRFDRFAKRVLGPNYNAANKLRLSNELASVVVAGQGNSDIIEVEEGFMRLDALNRIGNQVFADNMNRRSNYHAINAPVNYPHLWTASWFDWVQYDGSIMGPLIRNAGEAMGVSAYVDMTSSLEDNRFDSSIPLENLVWLEEFLGGQEPNPQDGFSGLHPPQWSLSEIDDEKASLGQSLYQAKCEGCHLPALNSDEIWQAQYFAPIVYEHNGVMRETPHKVLKLKLIDLSQVGTDPAQANVLGQRTLSTAGITNVIESEVTPSVGIDEVICGEAANQEYSSQLNEQFAYSSKGVYEDDNAAPEAVASLVDVPVKDGGDILFGFALGAIVQETINAWYKEKGVTDPALKAKIEGNRPNCIRATSGYKARPLNGVWATAPFLHNGSVATLRDLLCPANDQRPTYLELGNIRFDAKNVGLYQPNGFEKVAKKLLADGRKYTDEGYFILDTQVPGNSNSGHHFSDQYDTSKHYLDQPKGVIGTAFNEEQCDAIIEYLKTI
ncbi:di-heme-cytochrome C peroxidase [Echinimonas agarilytica]|uniref:Di-heme-cytochrome C peroxidase n=1 Tax=Echinimonas agarilytica TaxID=1215918 RepID=A0AA42B7N8_9GAMM|nr:di-heme-cytochrome C peroxidase [Echinimonas agarilytica]MCM2679957.1 di-heme-cytochrome C peroxidase [Echinimonas agarilytica]